MRVPGLRLTVWRMMILVAIVEFALAVGNLRRRSNEFRGLARSHAGEVSFYLSHARLWDQRQDGGCMELRFGASPEEYAQGARWCRRWAEFETELSRKYEYAAAHPWLPVVPDPPKPK